MSIREEGYSNVSPTCNIYIYIYDFCNGISALKKDEILCTSCSFMFSSVTVLRNDHKDITEKIEKNLQVLHSVRADKVAPLPSKDSGVQTNKYCLMHLHFRFRHLK